MFPIKWDDLPQDYDPDKGKECIEFDSRTDLSKLTAKLKNTSWKRKFYRINHDPLNYNELTYFHAFATKSIFDLQQHNEKDEWTVEAGKTMVHFSIQTVGTDYYQIETVNNGTYQLQLTGLSLHAYNTGVAILTINLENYKYPEQEKILCINEFGRRIYPLFLGNKVPFTSITKEKVLASSVELKCGQINNGIPVREDFSEYDSLDSKETHKIDTPTNKYQYNCIINFPNHLKKLFSNDFVFNANDERGGSKIRFNILTDDRMFFQCWYGNNDIAATVNKEITYYNGDKGYQFAQCRFWYAFMYGDKNPDSLGIANKYSMEREILEHTYTRWVEYGTLYGFTCDSFVALSQDAETLLKHGVPALQQHIKTIYYQIAVLCLAQRASVLRFSAEVSPLTQLGKINEKEALKGIQQLYLNYIEFLNTICFREVTPQIQGIEIYAMFRQAMGINEDVKGLDHEIRELHNFAMVAEQKRAADKAEKLGLIATWFLPAGVILGFMSINAFDREHMEFGGTFILGAWEWIFTAIILSVIITLLLLKGKAYFDKIIQKVKNHD
jgi:hypothetical protein